jgi:hypothetical protein
MSKKLTALGLFCCGGLLLAAACNGQLSGLTGTSNNSNSNTNTSANNARSVLPDAITLDTSELPDDTGVGKDINNNDSGANDDQGHDHSARTGGAVIHGFHEIADRALAIAAQIRKDITDPNQTQVSGTLHIGGKDVPYKADFAAFDFDGDGTPDGSGHANVEPVALRLWVDSGGGFKQFLCGLIATRPSDANLGAGAFYVKPSAARSDAPADLQFFVKYDRTDATHKWNEAFLTGLVRPNFAVSAGDARVDIRTYPDNHVEKTARTTVNFSSNPFGFTNFATSVHWTKGSPYALMSAQSTGGTSQITFTNVCVTMGQRHMVASSNCASFDTQDTAYLATPTGNETTFPTDFPATPTF